MPARTRREVEREVIIALSGAIAEAKATGDEEEADRGGGTEERAATRSASDLRVALVEQQAGVELDLKRGARIACREPGIGIDAGWGAVGPVPRLTRGRRPVRDLLRDLGGEDHAVRLVQELAEMP